MYRIYSIFLVICSIFSIIEPAIAANNPPTPAPITIQRIQDLSFGSFTSSHNGGTVEITANQGNRRVRGGLTAVGSNYHRAQFLVHGEPKERFRIILPSSLTLTPSAGGVAKITEFRSQPSITSKFDNNGESIIYVGGTLEISNPATAAYYNRAFDITIEYLF